MPNSILIASGFYDIKDPKLKEKIQNDPKFKQFGKNPNGTLSDKSVGMQEYEKTEDYANDVKTTFASLYKSYNPMKNWQVNSDLYEHSIGLVGAGVEGAANVYTDIVTSIASAPSAFNRSIAEFKWENEKQKYSQETLQEALSAMQNIDAMQAGYVGQPLISNDLSSTSVLALEGIDSRATIQKMLKTQNKTISDDALNALVEYSELLKARRKDVFDMDVFKNVAANKGNMINDQATKVLQKIGYLDEGDTATLISNINNSAGKFAANIGGVLGYVALQQFMVGVAGVGGSFALGTRVGIGAGLAVGGYSQFYETRLKALDKGWSFADATAIGLAIGAIETLVEYVPLHKMQKSILSSEKSIFNIWSEFAFPEGLEEFLSSVGQDTLEDWTGLEEHTLSDIVLDATVSFMYGALGGGALGALDYLNGQIGTRLKAHQQEVDLYNKKYGNLEQQTQEEQTIQQQVIPAHETQGLGANETQQQTTAPQDTSARPIEQTLSLPSPQSSVVNQEQQKKQMAEEAKQKREELAKRFKEIIRDSQKNYTGKDGKPLNLTEEQLDRIAKLCERGIENGVSDSFSKIMFDTAINLGRNFNTSEMSQKLVEDFYNELTKKPNIDDKTAKAITKIYEEVYADFGTEQLKDRLLQSVGIVQEKFKALGMTEEQSSLMSNFFISSIYPLLLKSGANPTEVVNSIEPVFINMNRARFNKQNVAAPSVLDDFSQVGGDADINADKHAAMVAWNNLLKARTGDTADSSDTSNTKFKNQSRVSANNFFYGQDEGHKDNTVTEQALLNDATIFAGIFRDMGIAENLTMDDFVIISTLYNKGYTMPEIFRAYGLREDIANQSKFEASANKVIPPLSQEEINKLNKLNVRVSSRKAQQGGLYDPLLNVGVVGTMASQGTAIHEAAHYTFAQAFYAALDMQSMGIVVSPEMNSLINTVKEEASKQLGRQPTYTELQETLAEATVNFVHQATTNNTGTMNKIVAELIEKATQDHIVNGIEPLTSMNAQEAVNRSQSRSAGSSESVYADISKKGKNKIQEKFGDVLTSLESNSKVLEEATKVSDALVKQPIQQARETVVKFLNSRYAQKYLGPKAEMLKSLIEKEGISTATVDNVLNEIQQFEDKNITSGIGSKEFYWIKNKIRALKTSNNLQKDIKEINTDLFNLTEKWYDNFNYSNKEDARNAVKELTDKIKQLNRNISGDQFVTLAQVSIAIQEGVREGYAYEYGSNLAKMQTFNKDIKDNVNDVDVLDEVLFSTAGNPYVSQHWANIRETFDDTKKWYESMSILNQVKNIKNKAKFFTDKSTAQAFLYTAYDILANKYAPAAALARETLYKYVKTLGVEYKVLQDIQERATEAFENLTKREFHTNITLNLFNGEREKAIDYAQSVAGEEGVNVIKDIYSFYERMYDALEAAGVSVHKVENYVARKMDRYQEWLDYVGANINHPLHNLVNKLKAEGKTYEEINDMIGGVYYAKDVVDSRKVSAFHRRKLKTVTEGDLPFYQDMFDTMVHYLEDTARTVMTRTLFGYAQDNASLLNTKEKILQFEKQLYEVFKGQEVQKVALSYNREIDKIETIQELEDYSKKNNVSNLIEGLSFDDAIEVLYRNAQARAEKEVLKNDNAIKERASKEIKNVADKTANINEQLFGKMNILMQEAIENGELNNRDMEAVITALQSLVKRKTPTGIIAPLITSINSLTLVTQFGRGPLSQLMTLGTISNTYGVWNTLRAFQEAMLEMANAKLTEIRTGKKQSTLLEKVNIPDVSDMIRMINTPVYSRFQKFATKWTGVETLDRLQKLTSLIASRKYMQSALSDPNSKEFKRAQSILDRTFAYDENLDKYAMNTARNRREQVERDLRDGNLTSDVEFFLFNVASDFNPLSILEVSPMYNNFGGWGKVFLQFITPIQRECNTLVREVKDGFNTSRTEGIKRLSYMVFALAAFGIPVEAIKALLQGKDLSATEAFVNSVGAPFLLDQFTLSLINKDGLFSAIISQFMPQLPLADAMSKDLMSWAKLDPKVFDSQTIRYVPFIGWFIYYHMGAGKDYLIRTNQELA